jgi:hypothetical protein
VAIDIELFGCDPTRPGRSSTTRWRRRGSWVTIRSTVARIRSGEGGRSRNQTLMTVDRSWGSCSMCQISASLLLMVSSYVILLMSISSIASQGTVSNPALHMYRPGGPDC